MRCAFGARSGGPATGTLADTEKPLLVETPPFAPAVALIALLACANATPSYDYDASAPLDVRVEQTHVTEGVKVADVSFRSGDGTVRAALVTPKASEPRMPGVLFVHWLGEAATTNRTEFMADALWLAQRGVASLLPDQPWSAPHWFDRIRSPASDAADSQAEVISLRRSLDVLLATRGVDATRVAYVGHDFGAMYGALLAGVDHRPASYVFMAPTITFAEWFLLDTRRPPVDVPAYAAQLAAFDIRASLARASAAANLLQFASHDEYVPSEKARVFASAVAGAKTVRTYDAGHDLGVTAATEERRAWLAERLRLGNPRPPAE